MAHIIFLLTLHKMYIFIDPDFLIKRKINSCIILYKET